jgi:cysteinyl-tRNA synthetase
MLTIYNSLTNQKEVFVPITPGKVNMYVCGVTVYDYSHIGHARMFVAFDFIVRYLRFRGYQVHYVRNITDIDDKIIKRAIENQEDINSLTERFITATHEDERALSVLPPDEEPRATQYIPHIIMMISRLITEGAAYASDNGDVYYQVNHFKEYGKLANKDVESLQVGARVEVNEAKRHPLDFVLWKASKIGEPSWPSPWGDGRPGWHIECSAMSTHCLGNHFDIHGGGHDLKFPHHENEIAQSEAATGEKFVNYWMHNGFVEVNKEKMSKSLGNFLTIREILQQQKPEVLRYLLVASHYRSPIHYSEDALTAAAGALERFYTALRGLPTVAVDSEVGENYEQRFIEVMDDDFNTSEGLAVLFDLCHEISRVKLTDANTAAKLAARLRHLAQPLGILQSDPDVFMQTGKHGQDVATIETLIAARNNARSNKEWVKADEFRDQLSAMGILIEDSANGTTWRAKD